MARIEPLGIEKLPARMQELIRTGQMCYKGPASVSPNPGQDDAWGQNIHGLCARTAALNLYADTSALVKLFLDEEGSLEMRTQHIKPT